MLGVILDLHAELYKDSDADVRETDTCYLLVLTTNLGMIKLDMGDDYQRYKMWATTINHMLMLSASFTKYELHYYKKWSNVVLLWAIVICVSVLHILCNYDQTIVLQLWAWL